MREEVSAEDRVREIRRDGCALYERTSARSGAVTDHSCPRQLKTALFGQVKPFVLNKPRL